MIQSIYMTMDPTTLTQSIFVELNLSTEHANIYLLMLGRKDVSVSFLSEQTTISRSTIYDMLRQMRALGIVTETDSSSKKLFNVISPDQLSTLLENNIALANKSLEKFKKISKNLDIQEPEIDRPSVQYLEGTKGMEVAYLDMLKSTEEVRIMCQGDDEPDDAFDHVPDYIQYLLEEMKIRKIKSREILEDTVINRKYMKRYHGKRSRMVLTKSTTKGPHIDKHIYDDKVVYISHRENSGIIIKSKTIARNEKELFDKLWEGLRTN